MPRYRHIVRIANRQLRAGSSRQIRKSPSSNSPPTSHFEGTLAAFFLTIAALHQENYATIANYLER
jgi:hypothetical protein